MREQFAVSGVKTAKQNVDLGSINEGTDDGKPFEQFVRVRFDHFQYCCDHGFCTCQAADY
jgi:hypothetical protein